MHSDDGDHSSSRIIDALVNLQLRLRRVAADATATPVPEAALLTLLVTVLALLTVPYALSVAYRHLRFVFVHWLRRPHDLCDRYGAGSWCVVTGGSQGIGLGFAVEFAKLGFNVVLMSRSREHLEEARTEVLAAGAAFDIQVRLVVIDFARGATAAFWSEQFAPAVADIDVSVLVNNVGINETDRFECIDPQRLLDFVAVNCTSQLLATRTLIARMSRRWPARRSAVISLSSVAGQRPLLYLAAYSATKAFNDLFSRALALELGDRGVDVLSCRPGYVCSSMSQLAEPGGFVLDRYECARGCMDKLGFVTETFGDWRHAVYAFWYALLPEWWLARIRARRLAAKQKDKW